MVMIQEEWGAQASGDDEALGFGRYTWLRGETWRDVVESMQCTMRVLARACSYATGNTWS